MFNIGISGHFCFKKELFNGQTIKTKMLATALEKEFGQKSIIKIDTHGGLVFLPKIIVNLFKAFYHCNAVIMLPAHNGIKIFTPLFVFLSKALKRKIHYVVIGGWLPETTKQKKWLSFFLKKFNGIYVETSSMKTTLEEQGFKNIFIMPNFKNLQILQEKDLVYTTKEPFAFCTFSRVMKEKGIEDAIEAINKINDNAGYILATLDIYGKIDDNYKIRFEQLQKTFPKYIQYKGIIYPTESVNVLKNYFALLFPTHYSTEGIPGTIIDSYSAGVPVITALWNNFKDIFIEEVTGFGFEQRNKEKFFNCIKQAIEKYEQFNLMKMSCLKEAQKYKPQNVINILLNNLKEKSR